MTVPCQAEAVKNQKDSYQGQLLYNRLVKTYRSLRKWARKNRITCFRLYDRDIPEVPLCIDLYTFIPDYIETKDEAAQHYDRLSDAVSQNGAEAQTLLKQEKLRTYMRMYLYERPYEKPPEEEKAWLCEMKVRAAQAVEIPQENILIKMRRHQRTGDGQRSQYEKEEAGSQKIQGTVFEQGQLFSVNLTDYIDTGLFLDHRPLRKAVRDSCKGKRVLNLFCYTGSFSVYAAEGGASFVESVDLSNTYLSWAGNNLRMNGFSDTSVYRLEKSDVLSFLERRKRELCRDEKKKFNIIILDPPTFSNSKSTGTPLDINRDWPLLLEQCCALMSRTGILYFSTNSRKLKLDSSLLPGGTAAQEITGSTIPEDFRNSRIHRAWKVSFAAP